MDISKLDRSGSDECYYRIMLRNGELFICQLQWFDEYDYDESEWITDYKFYGYNDDESEPQSVIDAVYSFINEGRICIVFDDERQNIAEEIYDNIIYRANKNTGVSKLKQMFN